MDFNPRDKSSINLRVIWFFFIKCTLLNSKKYELTEIYLIAIIKQAQTVWTQWQCMQISFSNFHVNF